MKKLLITSLAAVGAALLIGGVSGAQGKLRLKQNTVMSILDTVPDSPKKIQLAYYRDTVPDSPKKVQIASYNFKYDTVPDSPKKVQQIASYNFKYDTVPDSPKKIMQYANYKYDTVPDSPKKLYLVALK